MQKIIDGHIHLYPEKLMKAVLSWFEKNEGWTMPFKWSEERHIEYLHSIGVEELLVLGYIHKAGASNEINQWLADLSVAYPEVKPYACVHQDDPDKEQMIQKCLDEKAFFGVKIHCFVQKVSAVDQRFKGVIKLLAEREKGLVLHASSMPINTPYITPEDVEKLLVEYPGLRIMIAHLGLPEYHYEYLKLLDKYSNLFLDTAYIFGNSRLNSFIGERKYPAGFLRDALKNYSERIIYGSDFPVMDYSPAQAIEEIRSFGLGAKIEQDIFYNNAKRFMGLKVNAAE